LLQNRRLQKSSERQVLADSGNTEHHHEAIIFARQMTALPTEAAVRNFGSEEVRCSVN
jgi:hypothetical protein